MTDFEQNNYFYNPATGEQIIRFHPKSIDGSDILVPFLTEDGNLFRVNAKTKVLDNEDQNSAADFLVAYKKQGHILLDALIELEKHFGKAPSRSNCAMVLDYDGDELSVTAADLKVARHEIMSIFMNNISVLTKIGGKKTRVAPIMLSGALYSFLEYLYTTDRAALGLYEYDPNWEYSPDAELPKGNQFTTSYLESTLKSRVFDRNAIMSLITRYNRFVNADALAENGNKNVVINKTLAAFFGSYEIYSHLFEDEDEFNAITEGYDTRAPFILDQDNNRIPNTDNSVFSALDYFYVLAMASYERSPENKNGRPKPVPDQSVINMNELMFVGSSISVSAPDLQKHGRVLAEAGFFDGMKTTKDGFTVKSAIEHLRSAETKKIVSEFSAVVTKTGTAKEVVVRTEEEKAAAKAKAAQRLAEKGPTKPKNYAMV